VNSSVLRRAGPWAGLLVSRVPRRIVQPSPLEATIRSAAAWLDPLDVHTTRRVLAQVAERARMLRAERSAGAG